MASSNTKSAPRRPTGRRAGDSGNRAAILVAARDQFARKGYNGASLRTIAAAADVDPGLIRHFFGSKDDLFTATLDLPPVIVQRVVSALAGSSDRLGERLVDAYLRLWEDPESSDAVLAIVRSAISSDRAADQLQAIITARFLAQIAPHLDQPDREARAALAGAHLLGVAIARYVVRIGPIASLDRDDLIARCAPAVQQLLFGPPDAPPA